MVTTEFSSWASLDLWRQAGGHVLYSLGLGMGITISFSSYKVGEDNYIQVASLVALVNLVTSLLATSIIFIVLGFWTSTSGHSCVEKSILKLKNLIKRGMLPQDAKPPEDMLYLTTLDYLDWISKLPQYLQYQVIHFSPSCSIKMQKEKNSISTFRRYPKLLSVLICLGGFLGSLVFTSHAGSYIMSLFDDYLIPLTLVIIVTFQNVALACIYGARRVREEIFSDLGRLLWSFFIVLWCYVTLPGLLALTTIYFMQLYQMVPPYYIAWNSSMSQEVKQPYLQSTLGWVTFLSILTLLPIPVHPLYHWWYLQDHIASDPLEKLQPKKMPSVPPKPLQWPKHHLGKSQEKNSESSSKQLSLLLGRGLNLNLPPWQCSLPLSRSSQSSSWLSLPVITSLTSSFSRRSVSLPISRQVSPASVAVDNSELHTETKEDRSRMRTLFSNW
eukprot:XP_022279701.1 orphan sodium- and chloride-dependent neurotransmitter transporter NTT5-like isoform X4 [Canis lupus familiaris]